MVKSRIPAAVDTSIAAEVTAFDGGSIRRDRPDEHPTLTAHVGILGFGITDDGALFAELGFGSKGAEWTGLLPLAGLTTASSTFDRLTARGARLISQAARRELIERIQATLSQNP